MGLNHGTNIVKDGLVFYADPINPRSWTGPSSNRVNNLSSNSTGSIFNDTSFVAANSKKYNYPFKIKSIDNFAKWAYEL